MTTLIAKVFSFELPKKRGNKNGCRLLKDEEQFISQLLALDDCREVSGPDITGSYAIIFNIDENSLSDKEIISIIENIATTIGFTN